MEIPEVIRYSSIFSVGYPLVLYLKRIKKHPMQNHLLGGLIILSAAFDVATGILYEAAITNIPLINLYYLVFFGAMSWYYFEIHFKDHESKIWRIGNMLYILAWLIALIQCKGLLVYQSWIWVFSSGILMVFTSLYGRYTITHIRVQNPYLKGTLWIGLATFCYSCVNLGLFTVGSYVLTQMDYKVSMAFWSIHNVNNLIKNVLFAFGLASASLPNLLGNEKKQPIKF